MTPWEQPRPQAPGTQVWSVAQGETLWTRDPRGEEDRSQVGCPDVSAGHLLPQPCS